MGLEHGMKYIPSVWENAWLIYGIEQRTIAVELASKVDVIENGARGKRYAYM